MSEFRAFAPAKINLALHVTGQRADGYHQLDSLVAFADVGDVLMAVPAAHTSLEVTGPMAAGVPACPSNLVWKAADWTGHAAAFHLEKHLPASAGIGGGSSDAAAALRILADMGAVFPEGGAELGSDVPVCRLARAARMQGVGEIVTELATFPRLAAVLVNPKVEVSTPDVFRGLTSKCNVGLPDLSVFETARDVLSYLEQTRNDLEEPACRLVPEIQVVLTTLRKLNGAKLVRMSGSGATCFVLFDHMSAAQEQAAQLADLRPDWWVVATELN